MARRKIGEFSISEQGKALLDGMNPESDASAAATAPPETNTESNPTDPDSGVQTEVTPESSPPNATPESGSSFSPVSDASQPAADGQAAEPNSASPASLLDQMKGLGFQDLQSEDDARARLIAAYQEREQQLEQIASRYQQMSPLATYGQQYLQLMQNPAFQQFQAQAQPGVTQAPQPQQAQQEDKWWSPPQYDPIIAEKYREVKVDPATGEQRLEWKANTPAEVRASVEAHSAYLEKWADDLVRRPHEVLPKIIRSEFEKYFDERYGNIQQQAEVDRLASEIKTYHSEWMYRRDPRTNQILEGELTPAGQQAMGYLQEAMQMGIASPQQQWRYVERSMAADAAYYSQQSQSQQTTATQVAQQKKQELLSRGNSALPARGGSIPERGAGKGSRQQNTSLTPGQQFLAELEADGVLVS